MEQYMWIIWLVILVLSFIIEAVTFELVSIFFSLGALIALIMSFFEGIPYYAELIVFVLASLISLFGLRPLMTKVLKKQKRSTNIDEFINKQVTITKAYRKNELGEAKLNGLIWNVLNEDEKTPLEVGDEVKILYVSGNKLIVRIVKEDN